MSVPPWDFGKTRDKSGNPIVGYQRTDSASSPRWRKRAEGRQAGFTWVVWARGGGGQGSRQNPNPYHTVSAREALVLEPEPDF